MLNNQQLVILKNDIRSRPELWDSSINDQRIDDQLVADFYNSTAVPNYVIWRTAVPLEEIMANNFDWSRVDNLSVGKSRIWEWMGRLGVINPSKPNVRAGIDATWVGTAADLAVRASVYAHCKENATYLKKLFATGLGTDASPSLTSYEEPLQAMEVALAKNV